MGGLIQELVQIRFINVNVIEIMVIIGLFVVLTIYWNIITFSIFQDYSTVRNLKDYFKINDKIMIIVNLTTIIVFFVFLFFHWLFSKV